MRIKDFREIIKRREYVEEISHGEWADEIEKCWKKEIEILTEDIPSTIDFLVTDCSSEEYSWISEVLEDIIEKEPSEELVRCYKELKNKFPNEYAEYNIATSIEGAETILKWRNAHEKKD